MDENGECVIIEVDKLGDCTDVILSNWEETKEIPPEVILFPCLLGMDYILF